jgi:hypothetical protein
MEEDVNLIYQSELLSLGNFEPEVPETVSLDHGVAAPPALSPHQLEQKAFKAKYAFSVTGRSYDEIKQELAQGREEDLRREAAAAYMVKHQQARQQTIASVAARKGGPLSPRDIHYMDMLLNSMPGSTVDPSLVLEKEFAHGFLEENLSAAAKDFETVHAVERDTPDVMRDVKRTGSTLIAKQQVAESEYNRIGEVVKQQSYIAWGADLMKQFFPGYNEAKLRGNTEGVGAFEGGALGSNLQKQADKLWDLPTVEAFQTQLKTTLDRLAKDNPQVAQQFADYVRGKSSFDRKVDNVFTALDVAGIYGTVKGVFRSGKVVVEAQKAKEAVKQLTKAAADPDLTPAKAAEAVGRVPEGAVQILKKNIADEMSGSIDPTVRHLEALPSAFRVDKQQISQGFKDLEASHPGRYSQSIVNDIEEAYDTVIRNMQTFLTTVSRVSRLPVMEQVEEAARAIVNASKDLYKGHGILDISMPRYEPLTNTYWHEMHIGRQGKILFGTEKQARNYAEAHGFLQYEVRQKGMGHYIALGKPLDESQDIVKDFMIKTKNAQSPETWSDTFASFLRAPWYRTPEETLSLDHRTARKAATYAPAVILEIAKESSKEIRELAKWTLPGSGKRQRWNEWKRVVEATKEKIDEATGLPGRNMRDPGELATFYQETIGRLPDPQEVAAYFSYVRTYEIDRQLRNLAMVRNKTRLGVESHRFWVTDATGKRVLSDFIDGVVRKNFPGGEDAILVLGKREGDEVIFRGGAVPDPHRKRLIDEVASGKLRVIEIFDPEKREIANFSAKLAESSENTAPIRVRYVLAENVQTKNIDWEQVPRRGGGHMEYDYNFYIKQARMRREVYRNAKNEVKDIRDWYEGDSTVMGVSIRAMGKDMADKLDNVRRLIKAGDMDGAKALADDKLPMAWDEVKAWFEPSRDAAGKKQPPMLNLDEPIQVVPKDRLIADIDNDLSMIRYKDTFYDGTKRSSLARQNAVQFTGERDAFEFKGLANKGDSSNPLYHLETAKTVDPITSLNRSISRITQSTLIDDYKVFAVEHWLRESEKYLSVKSKQVDDVRRSPYYYFYNGEFLPGTPEEIRQRLEAQRYQIKQLMGVRNQTDTLMNRSAQALADSIYNKFGWVMPDELLASTKNPVDFIRGMTFHAKLGVFNVPQLLVQMQTYATIFGVAGARHAVPGTYAAKLHQLVRFNPGMLDHLDEMASKLRLPGINGFKPGEFKEAYEALRATGFDVVAGEHAFRDSLYSPNVVSSGFSRFLDMGTFFFKEGERHVRLGAWYTAYREWRLANPTGPLSRLARAEVLERADLLSVNMSRASNSALHSGILSIPTQFLTYQMRMAELFFGKRLSMLERGRLLAYNATLYGVPTVAGVTGLPAADYFRQKALENGYTIGDSWVKSALMEGLPAAMIAMTTGNWYNLNDRYAPAGFELMREIVRGDEHFMEIFGGAAYSTISGIIESTDGFYNAMMSGIRDDDKHFPLKVEDFVDIFKEISSVNNTWRTAMAINTGRWMSKKGVYMSDVTAQNAIVNFITGLSPEAEVDGGKTGRSITDIQHMALSNKSLKELENHVSAQFGKEFRRYLQALRDENPQQAQQFGSRAFALLKIGGIAEDKIPKILSIAAEDNKSLISRIDWSFYLNNAPKGQAADRMEAFQNILRRQNQTRGEP